MDGDLQWYRCSWTTCPWLCNVARASPDWQGCLSRSDPLNSSTVLLSSNILVMVKSGLINAFVRNLDRNENSEASIDESLFLM